MSSYLELEGLSEEEKRVALKLLSELNLGNEKVYQEFKFSEYKEVPVDIITFIKDDLYLGKAWHLPDGTCKLFPYWEEKLKELFPDNLSTSCNTLILSGARGLGKSEIAITCGLYIMYRLMCLKDPHLSLNLKKTEQVAFSFMNIKLALAEEIGISKFQNTVQLSPWFMKNGTMSGRIEKVWNPPDFITIIVGSQASDVLGQGIMFSFFDEISFLRNQNIEIQKQKAIEMIDTAVGGMMTRFIRNGKNPTLLVLGSSKRSEQSFLESYIKKKFENDSKTTMIVDEPIWNVRPPSEYSGQKFKLALGNKFLNSFVMSKEELESLELYIDKGYKILDVPIEFKEKFIDDVDGALRDYAGISSSELSSYIAGFRLSAIKVEDYVNPFKSEVLEIGNNPEDKAQYYNFFNLELVPKNLISRPLYIHLDMSLSGDKTGISGVWILGKKPPEEGVPQSKELYFQIAFHVAIKAPKGYQISFEKNRQFVYWLKEHGFNVRGVSSDTFQSADMKQTMLARGYDYTTISVDRVDTDHVCKPYLYFKNAIYENRIKLYSKCELLTTEIISLERNINTGKVDHPPNGSKDTADAVCGAIWNAAQNAEQFAFEYGETLDTITETNSIMSDIRQQVTIDFQEELKNMGFNKQFTTPTKKDEVIDDSFYLLQGIIL